MYKNFCFYFFYFFSSLVALSLCINFIVDPYNFLNHDVTDFISASNERNIKFVHLQNNYQKYNAVLIGSSRSSYIDNSKLHKYKMFNCSVSGISIDEYLPYLKFFEKTQGAPKQIILSLDFHATNSNIQGNIDPKITLQYAIAKIDQIIDYAKIKTSYLSLRLLLGTLEDFNDYYTRDFIKKRIDQEKKLDEENIKSTLGYYGRYCLNNYSYRTDYKDILIKIKESFPNSKIIVLICPIHESLFEFQKKVSGEAVYNKWIVDIKDVFESFYDFNQDKNMVRELGNFFDAAHFYPFVGDQLIASIAKGSDL